MARLGDLLERAVEERGWGRKLRLQAALALWDQIAGPAIASHSQALEVRGGTLLVRVKSAGWRSEIAFEKDRILAELNKHLHPERLKDIRFLA